MNTIFPNPHHFVIQSLKAFFLIFTSVKMVTSIASTPGPCQNATTETASILVQNQEIQIINK